jgi:hypothetical protein
MNFLESGIFRIQNLQRTYVETLYIVTNYVFIELFSGSMAFRTAHKGYFSAINEPRFDKNSFKAIHIERTFQIILGNNQLANSWGSSKYGP